MGCTATENAIESFREALERHGVHVAKMVLFGSQARGNAREDSDIDLIVVSPDFEGKDFHQRLDILVEALFEVREPIEPTAKTPAEWEAGDSLIVQFAREGKVVYEAGS
ncbi:MAG: nucleotidyltransferase domain-containing protein [Candidatus Hydrogenedentes bacterium]|nr:nucleotidyltransferase domain-containing protein [Candidatus Hydrogenedentota bacterium]MBI3117164.1 nucleotidyltransferase domain-containing protein [Candidatus Hydrogenedentota bacterium]